MMVEYSISEEDFIDAQRLFYKKSKPFIFHFTHRYSPGPILFVLFFLISALARKDFSAQLLPGFFFGLFFVSLWPILINQQYKKAYANARQLRGRLVLEANDNSLHLYGDSFDATLLWSHFLKYFEDDKVFVLLQNSQIFNLVPKRALSADQIGELRQMFNSKIGRQNRAAAGP